MGIQINKSQDIYRKTETSQKRNNGHYQTVLDGIKNSSNNSDSAKVKKGLSTYDAYALMKNLNSKFSANNLTTDSGKSAQKAVESSSEMTGHWQIYDKMERLQELADVYKEKYPSLVKSDGVAMGLAEAEAAGLVVRTENGIMLIACNGLSYMDNAEPSKSWHIMYSINDTNMYTEIINAMADGYITGNDIEEVSKWEKYFEEKELDFERILSDEELEAIE